MKNLVLGVLCAAVLASGCTVNSGVEVNEVGPRISDGYYAIENAGKYNVPMVAIMKSSGATYAYSFYWYECNGKVSSSYSKTGTTFSDSPVSAGGPNVTVLGENCELKSEIVADSVSTIKIKVKLNGVEQESYNLKKVSKEEFVAGLNDMAKASDSFSVSDDDCKKSLGESCSALKIESKE